MNISVEIKAPELANAINALANALAQTKTDFIKTHPAQKQLQNVTPMQTGGSQQPPLAVPTAPTQQETTSTQPAQQLTQPVQQQSKQPEQPQAVPTSSPTYTMDQLAVAATQLMDAGKREELVQLLNSFGVQALTALPKEQYGAFATKLRELGAKI